MKANEIMIGDWVSYHGIINKVAPADFCHKEWIDEIEPIPLTPEILEKSGFRRTKRYNYIYKDNYCEVCVSIVPKIKIANIVIVEPHINVSIRGALFDINMNMSAIHELQQAMRLLGIEKEIIL